MNNNARAVNYRENSFPIIIAYSPPTKVKCYYPHLHLHNIEIHYFVRKNGSIFIKDRTYATSPNTVFVIHIKDIHKYIFDKHPNCDKYTVLFNYDYFASKMTGKSLEVLNSFKYCHNINGIHQVRLSAKEASEIELAFSIMLREYNNQRTNYKECVASLLSHLLILIQRGAEKAPSPLHELVEDPAILKVITYIDEHFKEKIYLPDLANIAYLSPCHLSSTFKQKTGFRIKEYVLIKKITEAKNILEHVPCIKMHEIAYKSGFNDLSHFNHTFKRFTGYTPKQYCKFCQSFR
ncbi:MAG: AraC family transcriptional regulator [Elusimicrobiota bacterium]